MKDRKQWFQIARFSVLILVVILLLETPLLAQQDYGRFIWAKSAGGDYTEGGNDIAVLPDDSFLITGYFGNTSTFGLGESGETTLTAEHRREIFVAKYDPDGEIIWAKGATGQGDDEGAGIDVWVSGESFVTGHFVNSVTFGQGEAGQTILTSSGEEDIFLARFHSDGTLNWAKKIGGGSEEFGTRIAVHTDGSSLVTGAFQGTLTFGPGEGSETTLTSYGGRDIFIARFNSDGTLAWAKQAGGIGDDRANDITLHPDGSPVVVGIFEYLGTFGPGEPNETVLSAAGTSDDRPDIFVARFNTNGTLVWAKRAGEDNSDFANSVALLEDGSALVAGDYWYESTFGPGEPGETTVSWGLSAYVARYDPDGTFRWVATTDGIDFSECDGVTALSDGSALMTGHFHGTIIFAEGTPQEVTLVKDGVEDLFIAKYHPDGTFAWAQRAGGGYSAIGEVIATLSDDSVVLTGTFQGPATFGLGSNEYVLPSSGNTMDIFIARYDSFPKPPSGLNDWSGYR